MAKNDRIIFTRYGLSRSVSERHFFELVDSRLQLLDEIFQALGETQPAQ
jgi:hypothetical protein